MDIASKILNRQDRDGMLRRSLERIIQLYTDKSHFVYELLQNAEDAGATSIRFVQYADRLEVMHDGHPFTMENLQGLCDIGQSDKVNNLNQIGEFGVGFKSVFGICDTVRLYSAPSQEDLSDSCQPFAIEIQDFTRPVDIEAIDVPRGYTTLFVFPYSVGFQFSGFKSINVLNNALTKRLKNLGVTTLLFMRHLTLIEYEIAIPGKNEFGQYMLEEEWINDHCARVSAVETEGTKTDESLSFMKFSMPIDSKVSNRTIDIAFTVVKDKNGHSSFQRAKNPYISVYFPTETESKLGFIVQGPFRTTPNRSSVPSDDDENINLVKQLAKLLRKSLLELRDMGLVDLSLFKVLPLNREVFWTYSLFEPLYDEVLNLLSYQQILPVNGGRKYVDAKHALIARSKELVDILPPDLITELYNRKIHYEWLPVTLTETGPFKEVLSYLSGTLGIEVVRPEDLRSNFNENPQFIRRRNNQWLIRLYKLYETVPNIFSESNTRNILDARIIRTESGNVVAPYRKSDRSYIPNVFLPSKKVKVVDVEIVQQELYDACVSFFERVLHLKAPDEYEFFVNGLKKRYDGSRVDYPQDEHIQDITTIIRYLQNPEYRSDILSIIKENFALKCYRNGKTQWVKPFSQRILFPQSESGLQIEWYYRNITNDAFFIDFDMYQSAGITYGDLNLFGVSDSIIRGMLETWGKYNTSNSGRQPEWRTWGDFRWKLSIDKIEEALLYISRHPAEKDAVIKSQTIFRILQENVSRLVGTVHIGGSSIPDKENEPAEIVKILNGGGSYILSGWNGSWSGKWLYTESMQLVSHKEISKHELNKALYGKVSLDSNLYELLGFKKGKIDQYEAMVKDYDTLPEDKKRSYFAIELERRFGITPEQLSATYGAKGNQGNEHQEEEEFEFPSGEVRNWEALKKHAVQILSYANPVKYDRIVRSIRVSRPQDDIRAYLMNMYRVNSTYRYACQLCHKPVSNVEMCQLERKPDLELDPLNLCLCPNCAQKYKLFRNDEAKSQRLIDEIMGYTERDISASSHVSVVIGDMDFWFTQTHLAEIIELIRLKRHADEQKKRENPSSAVFVPVSTTSASATSSKKDQPSLKSDADVYKEYVGKRVRHRAKRAIARVVSCDGKYFVLKFENGPDKGKSIQYSMSMCIDNRWLEIIDED